MKRLLLSTILSLIFSSLSAQIGFLEREISSHVGLPLSDEIKSADFDGDGDLDLLVNGITECYVGYLENTNGIGNYSVSHCIDATGSKVYPLYPADLDSDGDIDIVGRSWNNSASQHEIIWYENLDGLGNFGNKKIIVASGSGGYWSDIHIEDVDGDGDKDIVWSNIGLKWYENTDNFETTPTEHGIDSSFSQYDYVSLHDIDEDGDMDLVAAGDKILFWQENLDGAGNFGSAIEIYSYTVGPTSFTDELLHYSVADIDNDGDLDIVSASKTNNEIGWFENSDGLGNFGTMISINANSTDVHQVYSNDLDGDGDSDILSVSTDTGIMEWYENTDGTGNFAPPIILVDNYRNDTYSLAIADFNYDGKDDIAYRKSGKYMSWLENLGQVSNEIRGYARMDFNENGCDIYDRAIPNLKVLSKKGNDSLVTFTSTRGYYRLLPNEGNYTTSIISGLPDYFDVAPNPHTSNFTGNGNREDVDFCITSNQVINDLDIILIPTSEARPGFEATYELLVKNRGTTLQNANITLEFDSRLTLTRSSWRTASQNSTSATFEVNNLRPFQERAISIYFTVSAPPIVEIGEILNFTAQVAVAIPSEQTPDENIFNLEQIVIGSYDPNDISVLEGDEVNIENATEYLNYVIRFQNTGTASAINVRIDHELDTNLDWETFTPLLSSHENEITITEGKNVEFLFKNILLPDSTSNEPASHGNIAFKIKPKSNIAVGDLIKGHASIYFDFNPPIITNGVTTEIIEETVEPLVANAIVVSPISCKGSNDASIQVDANGGKAPYTYELLDESFNVIISAQANSVFENLGQGNYIVKVIDDTPQESFTNTLAIVEPEVLEATSTIINVGCHAADDGSIEVNVSGGSAPYQYSINGGGLTSNNVFSNLAPASYTITVIDSNGCQTTTDATIDQTEILVMGTDKTDITCKGLSDGSIIINGSGGVTPYEFSFDGTNYSQNNNFSDLMPATYIVFIKDANSCIQTAQVMISEPNTPDFDNDGLGDSCDDDIDGDGIANENDKCSETPLGSSVNSDGCLVFSLPADNFTVQTTGASCPNGTNGGIEISAILPYQYTAVLTGNSVNESKQFGDSLNFENLGAGTYDICFTIAEHSDFEQCFSVEITEPEALSVSSKMDISGKSVVLNLNGGTNYSVNLNGTIYNTDENEIMLPLSKMQNSLTVSTDMECQRVHEETILMAFGLSVYPNPVEKGDVTVVLEDNSINDVQVFLYTSGGRQIFGKVDQVVNGVVKIDMDSFSSGMYSLKIETSNKTYTRKIIKK